MVKQAEVQESLFLINMKRGYDLPTFPEEQVDASDFPIFDRKRSISKPKSILISDRNPTAQFLLQV